MAHSKTRPASSRKSILNAANSVSPSPFSVAQLRWNWNTGKWKAAKIAAGSKEPNKTKVGKVTRKQVMDIVKTKGKDLNARNDEAAFRIIAGTARQMGLEIVD